MAFIRNSLSKLIGAVLSFIAVGFVISTDCPSNVCECVAGKKIICSQRKLNYVPKFTKTESGTMYDTVDLSRNSLENLGPHVFGNIKARAIYLGNNHFLGISPRAFQGLERALEFLDLHSANLYVVHWGVFSNLVNLKELDMSSNKMFAIPKGLFDGLQSLTTLNMAWNKLGTLKRGIFRGLNKLTNLNLMGNQIDTMKPGMFRDLRRLGILNLSGNKISKLEPFVFKGLDRLQRLDLKGNFIKEFPHGSLTVLPSLKQIFLGQNNLTNITAAFFNGPQYLEEIAMEENLISNISKEAFTQLSTLRFLKLSKNKIESLGEDCTLEGLENVQELLLQNNPIKCTCRLAWISELLQRGVHVEGRCASPDVFAKSLLSQLDFSLCEDTKCTDDLK